MRIVGFNVAMLPSCKLQKVQNGDHVLEKDLTVFSIKPVSCTVDVDLRPNPLRCPLPVVKAAKRKVELVE